MCFWLWGPKTIYTNNKLEPEILPTKLAIVLRLQKTIYASILVQQFSLLRGSEQRWKVQRHLKPNSWVCEPCPCVPNQTKSILVFFLVVRSGPICNNNHQTNLHSPPMYKIKSSIHWKFIFSISKNGKGGGECTPKGPESSLLGRAVNKSALNAVEKEHFYNQFGLVYIECNKTPILIRVRHSKNHSICPPHQS